MIVPKSAEPQLLRLRLTDVPGWHAWIDGKSLGLERFSGIMLQARIPPRLPCRGAPLLARDFHGRPGVCGRRRSMPGTRCLLRVETPASDGRMPSFRTTLDRTRIDVVRIDRGEGTDHRVSIVARRAPGRPREPKSICRETIRQSAYAAGGGPFDSRRGKCMRSLRATRLLVLPALVVLLVLGVAVPSLGTAWAKGAKAVACKTLPRDCWWELVPPRL